MSEYITLRRKLIDILESEACLVFTDEDSVFEYTTDHATDTDLENLGLVRTSNIDDMVDILEDRGMKIVERGEEIIFMKDLENLLNEMYIQYTMCKPMEEKLLADLFTLTIRRDI